MQHQSNKIIELSFFLCWKINKVLNYYEIIFGIYRALLNDIKFKSK